MLKKLFLYLIIKSKIIKPIIQNKTKEIRYSKKIEFNDSIVKEYFDKEINLNSNKFDKSLLKEAYFLNN